MSILDGRESLPEAAEALEEDSITDRAIDATLRYLDTSDPYFGKKAVATTTAIGGSTVLLTGSAAVGALALTLAGGADYIGDDYSRTNRLVDSIGEAVDEFKDGYSEGRYGQE